jgi:hypothetical protein
MYGCLLFNEATSNMDCSLIFCSCQISVADHVSPSPRQARVSRIAPLPLSAFEVGIDV